MNTAWIRNTPNSFSHFSDAHRERSAFISRSQNDPTCEVKARIRKRTVAGQTSHYDLCTWSRPVESKQTTADQLARASANIEVARESLAATTVVVKQTSNKFRNLGLMLAVAVASMGDK